MTGKACIRAEADRLKAVFEQEGAEAVEFDILQPAGTLLDLYGEDIRGRAFVTQDPVQGEMMLRPDFTVPLVSRLVAEGRRAGRFTYAGEVFRRQEEAPERDAEYLQVGFEVIGGEPAESDAEVFAVMSRALAPLGLEPVMGDIGLLRDAVAGLTTSEARKAALLHHLWRPRRFQHLLAQFASAPADTGFHARAADTARVAAEIGLRSKAEVDARIAAMKADILTPPIPAQEVALIEDLAGIKADAAEALQVVRRIAEALPSITSAADRLAARLDAMRRRGVDVDQLRFEGSYGRTAMEYYDGMVFGFSVPDRSDLPPIATGGRYDALTQALGDPMPAVGAVIRPGLAALAEGAEC